MDYSKLKRISEDRILNEGTLSGIPADKLFPSIDENSLIDKRNGVGGVIPPKVLGSGIKESVKVYGFIDKLRNANPHDSKAIAVILLENLITGDLERIEDIILPRRTINELEEIYKGVEMITSKLKSEE